MDEFISLTGEYRKYLIKKSAIIAVDGGNEEEEQSVVTINVGSEKSIYFVKDTIKQIQDKLEGFESYDGSN